ncbi:type III pantothenate kinase [Synechococcus sp. LTW-R]|uniref:type III pantothenate kinase n=1 Tax=Synechococcus sp. LTW-R TaxID=2751170 RepID=UPI0016284932|nr:type III pantothenate kinase [Synechococcus sp. LTW-R]QNG28656.1 type III pantothenate kinase [Synechococcus sp. LTW-R]
MAQLLLVGNSRWHWAERSPSGLRCWDTASPEPPWCVPPLRAWAAVGSVSAALALPEERRLPFAQVPLAGAPAWLGIDRALAGWWAWRQQQGPVLVADAGTSLSLTLVDAQGTFAGGRLSAGLALQLRSLHQGTAQLPQTDGVDRALPPWPKETAAAMEVGCLQAMVGAIKQAQQQLEEECTVWLTGGDAPRLAPWLEPGRFVEAPNLCLEALDQLS